MSENVKQWLKNSGATVRPIPPKAPGEQSSATILGGWSCDKRMPDEILVEAYLMTFEEISKLTG